MCGIVGLINHKTSGLSAVDRDIFKRLLFINVERGPDSTGIFNISNRGVCDVIKEAIPSPDFLKKEETKEILNKAYSNGTFLVGHSRKATQGSIKDENAHPFAEGDVVLVHNGSLWNHKSVSDVDVDSMVIAQELNRSEGNVTEVFNKLKGAYACVWYDNKTETLNFFRNKERPLFFYRGFATTFFASEWLMLYYAVMKENIKWESDKCIPLEPFKHIMFKKNKHGGAADVGQETAIEIKDTASNFQQGHTAQTGTSQTTGNNAGEGTTEKVSLNKRKKMRNEFQQFLANKKTGHKLTFTPLDFTGSSSSGWVVLGTIKGAPEFCTGAAHVHSVSEDNMKLLTDGEGWEVEADIVSWHVEHKNQIFQINLAIDPAVIHAIQDEAPTTQVKH